MSSSKWSKKDNTNPIVPFRWSLCKSYALAFAIAAFPALFLLDQMSSWSTSPILPGLLLIVVVWVFAPFVAFEAIQRARPNPPTNQMAMARKTKVSRIFIGIAALWFILWLAVGA
jgi:hypothetical protein